MLPLPLLPPSAPPLCLSKVDPRMKAARGVVVTGCADAVIGCAEDTIQTFLLLNSIDFSEALCKNAKTRPDLIDFI